ncbi:TonB-dependent receptor [Desulfuromonas sp. CSMB_57]|uniref:TonB-dependent receptor plug domain-containing protein n=1 Tax=Desulfuromonas sp. CSMB_57 TaxID=2807629 RepID=UPI001CD62748|nr:TonB-dependent receptor [Desulfuromonas sp. CSMB_57]
MQRNLTWMVWGLLLLIALPARADEVFSLGEVIVTGDQQVVNLATTVTEVTAEDIQQRGARTVAEALQQLPGVFVQSSRGKGESFVSIRGFNDNDVKIMIDGVPVYEQYSRQIDLAQFSTANVAKITVTKGASSVLYGPNAMGGVINIVTKTASKPTASVSAAWGDYSTQNYSVSAGAPIGDFTVYMGYNYRRSDGWRLSSDFDPGFWANKLEPLTAALDPIENGGKRYNSDYLQHHFNLKLGYEPSQDTKLYLTFNYFDNEKGVPTRPGWYFDEWKQWQLSLVGEQKVTDWLRIKARTFYVSHDDTLRGRFGRYPNVLNQSFVLSPYENYSTGGELQAFLDFGRWSFLKIGGSFVRDESKQREKSLVTNTWTPWETQAADTYSVGIENEVRPLDWLAFVAGLSYDYYDPRKAPSTITTLTSDIDSLNPQGGVVVTLSESTNLHGSIGKKTRFPHLKELYSRVAGGNPDLKPQETTTYEVGLTHAFNDGIVLSVAAFYNDIENLIARQGSGANSIYVNVGSAVTKGVEVALGADITESFWAGLNYTFMRTEDKDLNRELEGRPRHRANLDLRYRFPFGFNLSTQLSYVVRQYGRDNTYTPTALIEEWKRSPDFLLLNARAEQQLGKLWGVEGSAFVEVTNITDRDYYEVGFPSPGRNFLAGLNFRY